MLKRSLERIIIGSTRLATLTFVGVWLCLSPGSTQQVGSNCPDASDAAKATELQNRITTYDQRVRDGQVPRDLQAELDGLRKELAALLAKCDAQTRQMQPAPGSTPTAAGSGASGLVIDDCRLINCDCANVEAGLLTNSYRRQCLATESELKKMCEGTHTLKTRCHSTASGPNPFPK
jgi:hypothetical protein